MSAKPERNEENAGDNLIPFQPYRADEDARATRRAGELLHSEELRYLNQNFAAGTIPDPSAVQGGGPLGRLLAPFKRKIAAFLWALFEPHLTAEREYNARVVRFLNDVAKYVDARDASNFWELIRKIDYDVQKALDRIERLADQYAASLHSAETRFTEQIARDLGSLRASAAQHGDQLATLDSVVRGLEGIIARMKPATPAAGSQQPPPAADYSYLLLENRYRGSEASISERMSIYPPLYSGTTLPVLEIGAGRGELQKLFKAQAITSYGVDLDRAMVDTARSYGLDVRLENGLEHLAGLPDRSLGGVIAAQVVEHLTRKQLEDLFALCARKVAPGGKIIFETINPRSLLALSSNYFRDLTHVWPLHPDTLSYAMELAGLRVREVRMLSPVPREAQLAELPHQEFFTPQWAELVERLNGDIRQLNDLLYGYQDYCIVAEAAG